MLKKNTMIVLRTILPILCLSSEAIAMSLHEAISHAMSSNPRVLRSVKVCLANEQALAGARGGYYPTLDATASFGYEHSSNSNIAKKAQETKNAHTTLQRREFGLEARQMLFDGFSTMHEVGRSRFKLNASSWSVSNAANDAALRVTEAYINVLRERELLKSARENVRIHTRTSAMIEKRSVSGVSRNTDAVQSKGRLAQASSNKKTIQGHLKDAEIAFSRVTGITPGRLRQPRFNRGWLPRTEMQVLDHAIEFHPALRAANSDILEAMSQYRGSKSTMYPRIDLVAGLTFNKNVDGQKGRNDDRNLKVEARWNLINGGKDMRRIRQNAYITQESAEVRNNTYRQILENSSLAWVSYKTNSALLPDFKRHMNSARSTIDAYAKQFQLGQRTLLDLLNSENEYFSSKGIYINTKYDILLSKYRLLASMGIINDVLEIDLSDMGGTSRSLQHVMDYPDLHNRADHYRSHSYNRSRHSNHQHRYDHKYQHNHKNEHHSHSDDYEGKSNKYSDDVYHTNRDNSERYSSYERYPSNKRYQSNDKYSSYETSYEGPTSQTASNDYTIQLLATGSESSVKKFMSRTGISDVASYYRTSRSNGDPWYVLTYGSYDSKNAALNAIQDLPSDMSKYKPWARSFSGMENSELVYQVNSRNYA